MFEAARVPVLATAVLVAALALAPAPADGARWLQQQPIALPDALTDLVPEGLGNLAFTTVLLDGLFEMAGFGPDLSNLGLGLGSLA